MEISDQLAKALVEGIKEQMSKCPYHDVTVVVEDTEFKCHRFLLSACSEFFRALFQCPMKEDLDNKVVLANISSTVFKLIIDSIYFAKRILTGDNVSSVWHAASQLQIKSLFAACELFQSKRLSKDNCVNIYLEAKFLGSKKLQELSWDVIIQEFHHLRTGDEIMYLDFEDMKRLVGDDNLTVPSEDVVIETIIRWVKFKPNDFPMEGEKFCKLAQGDCTCTNTSISVVIEGSKDFHGPSKNKEEHSDKVLKIKHGSDCKQISTNCHSNVRLVDVVSNRSEFLFEMLTAGKLLLVSQACLLNLLRDKLVLEDPKAFSLVTECFSYNLQLGSRQTFCPLYGIHRKTSLLQSVTFTITLTDSNKMKYLFRTIDGKWFLTFTGKAFDCRAVTYGEHVYLTNASGMHSTAYKYDTSNNTWTNIEPLNVIRENHALVCLDNYIYAIGGIDCVTIERFDVETEQKVPGSGKWRHIGNLVKPMLNLMATTCNNTIVIFGSNTADSPSTMVQTFNIHTTSASIYMDDMSGSAKNMVPLKLGEDTFVLQADGLLWKVNVDSRLQLNIELLTMLWAKPLTLNGAVVVNQELLVFGVGIDQKLPREWDVYNFKHFKRIRLIDRQGYCFINTVIPKKFLNTPES